MTTPFDPRSRTKLTARDAPRFPDATLFHRLGRIVCGAECLPRKELFESWEMARRIRRRFRGGRVLEIAAGHGLVAQLLLLLDHTSPSARVVDRALPPSAAPLASALAAEWPWLAGRVSFEEGAAEEVEAEEGDLVVAAHACGALTDVVIGAAIRGRARLAALPCCYDAETCDAGGLLGWMDLGSAVDATRAARLRSHGYAVHTQKIPAAITPQNRLLLAEPLVGPRPLGPRSP